MGNIFDILSKRFVDLEKDATLLFNACQKIIGAEVSGNEYDEIYDNMEVKNLGWNSVDLANLAGGVEEKRWLNDSEVVSFYKALNDLVGE